MGKRGGVGKMSTTMNEEDWEDEVDPRIKGELERLNNASHQINLLEKDHEDAQAVFRLTLAESASCLKLLYDKLGKKVDQARPYYETLHQTKHVHDESEQAAARYERACDNHDAAKHMVKKAEEKLCQKERFLDSACQEMLNHATIKVMQANQEKNIAQRIHLEVSQAFNEMQEKTKRLHKNLKSVIHKTRSYFELKEQYNKILEGHKRKVFKLQNDILDAKQEYHAALRNLEKISDTIHERRSSQMNLLEPRGQGVGAESPDGVCLIESGRPDNTDISLEVEKDMESAMKSLTLQKPALKQDINSDESQESFGEVSLGLSDSEEEDNTSSASLQTPPLLKKTSIAMEGKLFVSPLTREQSEDDIEDNSSVRLEKWFFFSPAVDKKSIATEKLLNSYSM